jgi:nucleotide-binding universal stress UspA family protein
MEASMFKNVLIAYDGSEHATKAVEIATELASKLGASLHLVYVVAHEHAAENVAEFAASEHVESADLLELEAARSSILIPLEGKAQASGVKEVLTQTLRGDPAEQILSYANHAGVDLIVMGRRGLGRIEGLLVGSVSSKIGGLAPCPVMTVK